MEPTPERARPARAAAFGAVVAVPVALVYGVLADPFGLSWGLIVVGLAGGAIVGAAIAQGAWAGAPHPPSRPMQWLALVVSAGTWVAAALVAYVASQLFYQQATTPFLDRLSVGGLVDYLVSTVLSPSVFGLAAMTLMAWRGAR